MKMLSGREVQIIRYTAKEIAKITGLKYRTIV